MTAPKLIAETRWAEPTFRPITRSACRVTPQRLAASDQLVGQAHQIAENEYRPSADLERPRYRPFLKSDQARFRRWHEPAPKFAPEGQSSPQAISGRGD